MNNSILEESSTAGLEDQLGCASLAAFWVAAIIGFTTIIYKVFSPKLHAGKA